MLPFIIAGVIVVIYFAWQQYKSYQESRIDAERFNDSPRKITLKDLREYDGVRKPIIFVAVKGTIFDVTDSGKGPLLV